MLFSRHFFPRQPFLGNHIERVERWNCLFRKTPQTLSPPPSSLQTTNSTQNARTSTAKNGECARGHVLIFREHLPPGQNQVSESLSGRRRTEKPHDPSANFPPSLGGFPYFAVPPQLEPAGREIAAAGGCQMFASLSMFFASKQLLFQYLGLVCFHLALTLDGSKENAYIFLNLKQRIKRPFPSATLLGRHTGGFCCWLKLP